MRRVLGSSAVTVVAFAGTSFWFVATLYGRVMPFRAYRELFGGLLPDTGPSVLHGLAGVLAGLAIASLSCLLGADARSRSRWHRLDYSLVVVVWLSTVSLVSGFFEKGRADVGWHVACLTVLAVTSCYVWATTIVRLRARTLGETMLWPRVFRTLPLNQFSGIFILAVVVIAGVLLVGGVRSAVVSAANHSSWDDIRVSTWLLDWFTAVGLPAATIGVIAVLSLNILSITAAKERAVEARLREERFRAELITNVTHDIRTPLTSIVNYVDLIDKLQLDDPRLAEYTEVLGRKAERLKVLIGDLLDASRASAGNLPVRLEPIEVTEILAQIAGDFDEAFAARGLVWVGPAVGHDVVEADGEHLWRILENLVGNVVKYAEPGSCVHADLLRMPGWVRLQLTNRTAEPIFASAEQLMSQFVRGDASRHNEGSGLGLFIADRLARLMGASLAVAVEGDRFTAAVDLPVGRALTATERSDAWEPTRLVEALEPTHPIELEPAVVLVGDQGSGGGRA